MRISATRNGTARCFSASSFVPLFFLLCSLSHGPQKQSTFFRAPSRRRINALSQFNFVLSLSLTPHNVLYFYNFLRFVCLLIATLFILQPFVIPESLQSKQSCKFVPLEFSSNRNWISKSIRGLWQCANLSMFMRNNFRSELVSNCFLLLFSCFVYQYSFAIEMFLKLIRSWLMSLYTKQRCRWTGLHTL